MIEFAAASGRLFLNLLLHHDDGELEYAYTLQVARERGWTVVSMKTDFKHVFPS